MSRFLLHGCVIFIASACMPATACSVPPRPYKETVEQFSADLYKHRSAIIIGRVREVKNTFPPGNRVVMTIETIESIKGPSNTRYVQTTTGNGDCGMALPEGFNGLLMFSQSDDSIGWPENALHSFKREDVLKHLRALREQEKVSK